MWSPPRVTKAQDIPPKNVNSIKYSEPCSSKLYYKLDIWEELAIGPVFAMLFIHCQYFYLYIQRIDGKNHGNRKKIYALKKSFNKRKFTLICAALLFAQYYYNLNGTTNPEILLPFIILQFNAYKLLHVEKCKQPL